MKRCCHLDPARVCVVISLAPRVYTGHSATGNGHWMRAFLWTILISRTSRHGDGCGKMAMARGGGRERCRWRWEQMRTTPDLRHAETRRYLTHERRARSILLVRHDVHIRESSCRLLNESTDLARVKQDTRQKSEVRYDGRERSNTKFCCRNAK